jgi:PleD family two-component response regulator
MRILVVDDSEDWRELTEAALKGAGFHDVRAVASAAEAFKELRLDTLTPGRASPVDLIILDVMMPEMDGIEACGQIRSHPNHADVPIIMLTVADDAYGLANAFAAGATDYIAKPFNRLELLARVRSALNIKAELDRRRAREEELIALATQDSKGVSRWIDSTTRLFTGEVAEAYTSAINGESSDEQISVLALAIDQWDALKTAHGEEASEDILVRLTEKVSGFRGTVGTIAAIYLDDVIVLVAPRLASEAAKSLAEALRDDVSRLHLGDAPEAAGGVTVSIGTITARMGQGVDRQLINGARTALRAAAANSGNRVVAVDLSC